MARNGIDHKSNIALTDFLRNVDFKEAANGDAYLSDVHVDFKAGRKRIVTMTEVRILRTAWESGKIICTEQDEDSFNTDHCHVDYDAGWERTTYSSKDNVLTITGSSHKFKKYTVTLTA